MALNAEIGGHIQAGRGRLILLAPIAFGSGIVWFFSASTEPVVLTYIIIFAFALIFSWFGWRFRGGIGPVFTAIALLFLGFCASGYRAHQVKAPVLEYRYYGNVEGRVIQIDRSASGAPRLLLDKVWFDREQQMPEKIRISLHGNSANTLPGIGARINAIAFLSPPMGPEEPGGFDFRRYAWFLGIGAVGYTRNAIEIDDQKNESDLWVQKFRAFLSAHIQERLPGAKGGFATAIITGDRSALPAEQVRHLRETNLAHLLAISGLHMGLLAGCVFWMAKMLVSGARLKLPFLSPQKIAALIALTAASGYLLLSGGNIATERAFLMAAVALGAVLVDRSPISIRAVALAAMLILLRRPESLLAPGFQMSFSATLALVAIFQEMNERKLMPKDWKAWPFGVVLSSGIAGIATMPFAASHFNRIASYGFVANFAAVPLMGILIMPAGLIAVLLIPIGLDRPFFQIMGLGLSWILFVAEQVSSWQGALRGIASPPSYAMAFITVGGVFALGWRGVIRWIGAFAGGVGLFVWINASRPDILISSDRKLIGVKIEGERVLNKPRGQGFAARVWLENDGSLSNQREASKQWNRETDMLVQSLPSLPHRSDGSIAIWLSPIEGRPPVIVSAAENAGERLWTQWQDWPID